MTAPTPVLTLDYGRPQMLISSEARRAFRLLLLLSILSGLCVASCFLTFTETMVATIIHVLVFTTTIALAVRFGQSMMRVMSWADDPSRGRRLVLDLIALLGVAMIGAAPVAYQFRDTVSDPAKSLAVALLGVAYGLMALTTARHVMLYRLLAGLCRGIQRPGMARSLVVLGWFKAIYEFLW